MDSSLYIWVMSGKIDIRENIEDEIEELIESPEDDDQGLLICTVRNRRYGPSIVKWQCRHRWKTLENSKEEFFNIKSEADAERFIQNFKEILRELTGFTEEEDDNDVFSFVQSPSFVLNHLPDEDERPS